MMEGVGVAVNCGGAQCACTYMGGESVRGEGVTGECGKGAVEGVGWCMCFETLQGCFVHITISILMLSNSVSALHVRVPSVLVSGSSSLN